MSDHLGRLFLGANEQKTFAASGRGARPFVGVVHADSGLHEVNDVNSVARAIDVARHLGIPATGLVTEMGTSFHHLGESDDSHGCVEVSGSPPPVRDGVVNRGSDHIQHPKQTGVRFERTRRI